MERRQAAAQGRAVPKIEARGAVCDLDRDGKLAFRGRPSFSAMGRADPGMVAHVSRTRERPVGRNLAQVRQRDLRDWPRGGG